RPVGGVHLGGGHEVREVAGHLLLVERAALDPVREPLHADRPAAQVRQHPLGQVGVVARAVRLRHRSGLLGGRVHLLLRPADPHAGDGLLAAHLSSRTTSRASLSVRRRWTLGWRSWLADVHSVNATCATSSGRTKCTPTDGSFPRVHGERCTSSGVSRECRARSTCWLNPVPTLPAYTSSSDPP